MPRAKKLISRKQRKNKIEKPENKRRKYQKIRKNIVSVQKETVKALSKSREGNRMKINSMKSNDTKNSRNSSQEKPFLSERKDINMNEDGGDEQIDTSFSEKNVNNVLKPPHLFIVEPDGVKLNPNFSGFPKSILNQICNNPFEYYPDSNPSSPIKENQQDNTFSEASSEEYFWK